MRMTRDVGDILDRYSIATLKRERIGSPDNLKEFHVFKLGYEALFEEFPDNVDYLRLALQQLKVVNSRIWDLESAIRQGYLDKNLQEVGNRAVSIRKINAKRIAMCNGVNKFFREGVRNVKQYHLSGEVEGCSASD